MLLNAHVRSTLFILFVLTILSVSSSIQANDEQTVESVTIIGTKEDVKKLPGSGAVINNEDLQKAMDTDIHKILSAVPGVYFRT